MVSHETIYKYIWELKRHNDSNAYKPFLHTITTANGKEFAMHEQIAQALRVEYYFAHPYHSWERERHDFPTPIQVMNQLINNIQVVALST